MPSSLSATGAPNETDDAGTDVEDDSLDEATVQRIRKLQDEAAQVAFLCR